MKFHSLEWNFIQRRSRSVATPERLGDG